MSLREVGANFNQFNLNSILIIMRRPSIEEASMKARLKVETKEMEEVLVRLYYLNTLFVEAEIVYLMLGNLV